jgi:uncharacterized protein (DUF427 family)
MKAIWNGKVVAESAATVVVDGKVSDGGAWYYPEPKPAADNIRGYFAFWRGVKVEA